MDILQINLNNCETAHNLMMRTVESMKVDIVLVSEPYRVLPRWIADNTGRAAIWVTGCNGQREVHGSRVAGDGFVSVDVGDTTVFSCYFTPRFNHIDLGERLDELEAVAVRSRQRIIVAGDFNAKCPAWGSSIMDSKGRVLMESFNRLGLQPVDSTGEFSFARNGRVSKIDVLACDAETYRMLTSSSILDEFTASYHFYLRHIFAREETIPRDRLESLGWKAHSLKPEVLMRTIRERTAGIDISRPLSPREIEKVLDAIETACAARMTRSCPPSFRGRTKYWWSAEIADLRRSLHASRRRLHRARRRENADTEELLNRYREARNKMKILIIRSKEHAWRELCQMVEGDV